MNENEQEGGAREPYPQDTTAPEAELVESGWARRFVADEPRLSESIALYESLDFEVKLRLLGEADLTADDCTECFKADPSSFRVIYTRKQG